MHLYLIFWLFMIAFLLFVFIGLPIGLSLGAVGSIGFLLFLSPGEMMQIGNISFNLATSETLIVVPMFLLMGQIISICDTAEDFYSTVNKWLYWLPGSLAVTSTITSAGFAAISGSSTASAATIGTVSVPPMLKRKYSKKLACGVVTSGGALGILIPPSLAFIVYGFLTETPVPKLFIAGIVPGIVIGFMMIIASIVGAKIKPSIAPRAEKSTWKERLRSFPKAIPLLLLASLVSTFLYLGIATVTEVAALGVISSFIVALIYRRLTILKLKVILLNTIQISGMIMMIVIGGTVFSFVLTSIGIPHKLAEDILSLSANPWCILITINILLIVLGCFLDAICIQIITMPFLFPIIMNMGFDPIWFGVIVIINMEIGLLTPPVGVNLYALAGVVDNRVSMRDIVIGSLYFNLILVLGLIIIIIFPQLSLWLPKAIR